MLARLLGKTFMLSTNLSGPQLICRHFLPDLQRMLDGAHQPLRGLGAAGVSCLVLGPQ